MAKKTTKKASTKRAKRKVTKKVLFKFGTFEFDDCILYVLRGDDEKTLTDLQNTGLTKGLIRFDNPTKTVDEDKIFVVLQK